jgi:hypothetical protein
MILLTIGIAIPDEHARLTRLETNTPSCHAAAIGTAVGRRIVIEIGHGPAIKSSCTKQKNVFCAKRVSYLRYLHNEDDEGACAVPTIEVCFVIVVVVVI